MNLIHRLLQSAGHRTWALIALIVVTGAVYSPVMWGGFVSDDALLIAGREPLLQAGSGLTELWTHDYAHGSPATVARVLYRPWISTTFWLDYQLGGLNPAIYHGSNLLVHLANTVLQYLVLAPVISSAPALLVAMLAGVAPGALYSVGWISGRTDLWVTLFTLTVVWLWGRYRERRQIVTLLLMCCAYLLAMLSKETGLLAPLLAWLIYRGWPMNARDPKQSQLTAIPRGLWWLVVPAVLAFFLRRQFAGGVVAMPAGAASGHALMELPEQLWRHAAQLWVPLSTPLYSLLDWSRVAGGAFILVGWIALLAMAVLITRGFLKQRPWAAGAIWFAMALLPIYLLGQQWRPVTYFYAYFGIAGWWLFTVDGLRALLVKVRPALLERPTALVVVSSLAVAGYAAVAIPATAILRNDLTLYSYQARCEPRSAEAQIELAGAYLNSGDTARGLELARLAADLDPSQPEPARKLVEWYIEHDDLKSAAPYADRIYEHGANDCACLATLGYFYTAANHCQEALGFYQRAFDRCQPTEPMLFKFGLALMCAGDYATARQVYAELVQRNPHWQEARDKLGECAEKR